MLIGLSGGMNFPLVRDTFYFAPVNDGTVAFHVVPTGAFTLAGGVGVHFF